ncbi:MAG: RIP metalloprotease RseP, partial [Aquabacterium sp.]|uniref:RIP metalloprotease RseP n=1 Tax=Aquabacterium sp. TaxID=1872578 RepID=UPI00121E4BFA
MLLNALAFIVMIGVLVVIHEYGHYRVAVACDVKVLRFSVGFGRVLWSRMRGETEFVISALPLGGYVKMLDEREGVVDPTELHRAFNRKPVLQRAMVVVAGPVANLLLAILLYASVNWAGVSELRPWFAQPRAASLVAQAGMRSQDEIVALKRDVQGGDGRADDAAEWHAIRSMNDLQWWLTSSALSAHDIVLRVQSRSAPDQAPRGERELHVNLSQIKASEVDGELMDRIGLTGPYAEPLVSQTLDGGPAQKAGLRKGDKVLLINGVVPADATQLRQVIRESQRNGQPLPLNLQVQRGQEVLELSLTPVMKDVQGKMLPRIEAGLGGAVATVDVRYGFLEGLTLALDKTWGMARMSLEMLGKMVVGQVSVKNLSGPLAIADLAGQSARLGWVYYIGALALVSVSLG